MGRNYFCENDFELELNSEYHLKLSNRNEGNIYTW